MILGSLFLVLGSLFFVGFVHGLGPPFDFTSLALRFAQGTRCSAQNGKKEKKWGTKCPIFFLFSHLASEHRSLSGAFNQAKRRLNAQSKGGANPWSAFLLSAFVKKSLSTALDRPSTPHLIRATLDQMLRSGNGVRSQNGKKEKKWGTLCPIFFFFAILSEAPRSLSETKR